jgi:hypothetical protein
MLLRGPGPRRRRSLGAIALLLGRSRAARLLGRRRLGASSGSRRARGATIVA